MERREEDLMMNSKTVKKIIDRHWIQRNDRSFIPLGRVCYLKGGYYGVFQKVKWKVKSTDREIYRMKKLQA